MLLPGLSARHAPLRCAEFSGTSLEQLRQAQAAFVDEREWSQFHTPRSLALAMVGEVGEVCELLQWRGDAGASPGLPGWTDDEREALADELSDVLSYVVRLADVTDIDLPEAFLRKVEKNRAKYPSERARGSAAKYTRYAVLRAARPRRLPRRLLGMGTAASGARRSASRTRTREPGRECRSNLPRLRRHPPRLQQARLRRWCRRRRRRQPRSGTGARRTGSAPRSSGRQGERRASSPRCPARRRRRLLTKAGLGTRVRPRPPAQSRARR